MKILANAYAKVIILTMELNFVSNAIILGLYFKFIYKIYKIVNNA